jgi:hypothetical protein
MKNLQSPLNEMSFGLRDLLVFVLSGSILLRFATSPTNQFDLLAICLLAALAVALAIYSNPNASLTRTIGCMVGGVLIFSFSSFCLTRMIRSPDDVGISLLFAVCAGIGVISGMLLMLSSLHWDN